jgi:lipopolysaccharide export system protein LptC
LGATLAMFGLLAYQAGTFESLVPPSAITASSTDEETQKTDREQLRVRQSSFTGFDRQQQPFSVTALNAIQDQQDRNKVRLVEVAAQMKRKTGEEIALSSQNALYDSSAKTIDLEGKVIITTAGGFTAKMETAKVNIDEHRLRSEVPVEVTTAQGTIRSNGMEIIDDGARILFFNGVKATFGGKAAKDQANDKTD